MYQKRPWKRIYREKYSDPLTDTLMGHFGELNIPQPPEETFDNSPIKLREVKDFVRKARAKAHPVLMVSPINCIKDALKFWHLFGNSYE